MQSEGVPTIGDLGRMTTKAALLAVSGPAPSPDVKNYAFKGVDIVKSAPTVCRFVLGNPKALYENPLIAKSVGLDFSTLDMATPLSTLAPLLPVLYVADWHSEYGTLGFLLNKPTGQTLGEVKPEYKAFRQRPVYLGGVNNRGNSFTMMHAKAGFPDNRPFRALPPDNSASASSTAASTTVPSYSFKLFFSPDVAMANELCLTNDASPSDFKFFQWAHVWLPNQLELEYTRKAWLTVAAPQEVIFVDDGGNSPAAGATKPLWQRLVHSLPPTRLG
jgi:putative AlgH/UPF0301 family transcriptional regulator